MSENVTLQNSIPLETIIHRTASRPFSLYRTVVDQEERSALYLHCHPEAELFYLEEGMVDFQVESCSFSLQAGEGIFIPPNQLHSAMKQTDCSGSCSHRAVVFDLNLLEQNLPPYCQAYFAPLQVRRADCVYPIKLDQPKNKRLLALLPAIFTLQRPKLEQYELSLTGILLLCWQELYNLCFSELNRLPFDSSPCKEIQKSIDYLQHNFADSLTLADLSKKAGFSESYFCHSFKNCTGYTPFAYLNRLRIVKSCELLARTNKKITEIASLCGFNNISYFNRTFYKTAGTTPSAYRSGLAASDRQNRRV